MAEEYAGQSLGLMPAPPALPPGVYYVDVACNGYREGQEQAMARRSDGVVVAWGANQAHQLDVPAAPAGQSIVEIAAGTERFLARRGPTSTCATSSLT